MENKYDWKIFNATLKKKSNKKKGIFFFFLECEKIGQVEKIAVVCNTGKEKNNASHRSQKILFERLIDKNLSGFGRLAEAEGEGEAEAEKFKC